MSIRAFCPGCNSETSSIYRALQDGGPCPSCGLPAEVILAVEKARARNADEQLLARLMEAERRAAVAEKELAKLKIMQQTVRDALDADYGPPDWN